MIAERYSLDSEIGRGGMGVVWRGEDQVLGRDVALKRIGMAPGGASADLLRAEREARLAASLNHPNVVAVFDLVVENDEHWLVMEYVDSRNLAEVVRTGGPLQPESAARLMAQAADALAAAHDSGIVHRDVKPSNILVSPHGRVKLTDFGIARMNQDATLTQTGMVTGSPAYIAPEVASGSPATPASDVWSLGATLYHALSGTPPYDVKDNMVAALYRIVHEDPPRLPDAGWLTQVLEATMARDPDDRWTMAQVRDFLMAPPGPDETRATATQVVPATVPLSEPDPTPDATPAPVTTGTPTPPETIAATPREREPRDRRRLVAWLVGGAAALVAALLLWLAIGAADDGEGEGETGTATEPSASAETSDGSEPSDTAAADEETATEEEMVAFGENYVPTAISDPDTSWEMLTPEFQNETGRASYDGFWSTIADAEVYDVTADTEEMTVTYTVEYTRQNGSKAAPEQVTLGLVKQGGELLVAEEF